MQRPVDPGNARTSRRRAQSTIQISMWATPMLKSSMAWLIWTENSRRLSALRALRTRAAAASSFAADCSHSQSLASTAASPIARSKRRARRLPSSRLVCRPTSFSNSAASLIASAATSQSRAMQATGAMASTEKTSAPDRDNQVFRMPSFTRNMRIKAGCIQHSAGSHGTLPLPRPDKHRVSVNHSDKLRWRQAWAASHRNARLKDFPATSCPLPSTHAAVHFHYSWHILIFPAGPSARDKHHDTTTRPIQPGANGASDETTS